MTELKTLKDILHETEMHSEITPDMIKEEAIKWIKEIEKDIEKMIDEQFNEVNKLKLNGLVATSQWIKMFFNITEEDLKWLN